MAEQRADGVDVNAEAKKMRVCGAADGMNTDTSLVKLSQPLRYVVFRFAKPSIHVSTPNDHNITGNTT